MSLFAFDPESIATRVQASGQPPKALTLPQSMTKGALAFCVVSLLGFAPWAFGGRAITAQVGEGGLYALCALAFMGSAGVLLRSLVIGPVPLGRFYGLFASGFFLYAVGWCVAWFSLARRIGMRGAGLVGALVGTILMGIVILEAFGARQKRCSGVVLFFLGHTAGYFLGDLLYGWSHTENAMSLLGGMLGKNGVAIFGKLLWGVAYGLGMGAGLGALFHAAQTDVRARLSANVG
jgi:hypothetical protein